MKTLFVCATNRIDAHVGEEYDAIREVENFPTTETIDKWANTMREDILALHRADKAAGGDGAVSVNLDAHPAYHGILLNYQVLMANEGVRIELPYHKKREVTDAETIEVLKKYGEKA